MRFCPQVSSQGTYQTAKYFERILFVFWIVYPPTLSQNCQVLRERKILGHKSKPCSYRDPTLILPSTSHAFLIPPRYCCCFDNIYVCQCMPG
ncbi:uncharacterized protein EDB91DRAFT_881551 [Suillus paluster]|uniref:uncharacterized protein n=1 Tax=Suillus paluster TaxID=48578 RepID=UPI001B871E93|nr:uncharacterized protein EDB91DRAFT_881551 [Suillus paluster]KAG1748486.1 hypothetical protein EDB91DRAFT_881551 [Suillus paluster]